MNVFTPGSHGSTFGGNPLACAVSIEALKIIQRECIPNVNNVKYSMELIKTLKTHNDNIIDIRGTGLFWGVQFHPSYDLDLLRLKMLQKGYITCTSRNNTLRLTPPLTISIDEIKKSINTLSGCLETGCSEPPTEQDFDLVFKQ
jgi:ornithine--oxo-acid transaminase